MAGAAGPQLQLQGERTSGQDVRTQNATAVQAVANILKTSLGPVGLDKVRQGLPAGRAAAAAVIIPSLRPCSTPCRLPADAGGRHWRRDDHQ